MSANRLPLGECLICDMDDVDDAAVVARDDLWALEIAPGYEVPGWFFLRARRHAIGLPGLTDDELATLGPRARDAVAAVGEATSAPAIYLLSFGENYQHFHALIAARGQDVPPARRAGDILKLRTERLDPDAAGELVPSVRAAYGRRAGGVSGKPGGSDVPGRRRLTP